MGVHITQGLYLSGELDAGDYDPNNPVVGYRNRVIYSGVDADSQDDNFLALNIANYSTDEYWKSLVDTEQHVTFNFPLGGFNYCAIAGHNLTGAMYRWQYKVGLSGTWTDITEDRVVLDNNAIMDLSESIVADFVRLKITPLAGKPPAIAVVYIGERLTLPRRIYVGHTPIIYGRKIRKENVFSDSGAILGAIVKNRSLNGGFSMSNIPPAFYRSHIEPWALATLNRPYFWAWRPEKYPDEIGYVMTQGEIMPENELSNGFMKFSVNYRGLYPWD